MMFYAVRCKRAGFTLIEIMIVIAIIAILAGIVVPSIMRARFEANITACQENCRIGMEAVQMAKVRHTKQQLANLLQGGTCETISFVGGSLESCVGHLDGPFVEAGYLEKPLKCSVNNITCCFLEEVRRGNVVNLGRFYRDFERTQPLQDNGNFSVVYCYLHIGPGGALGCPAYEENLGACFFL